MRVHERVSSGAVLLVLGACGPAPGGGDALVVPAASPAPPGSVEIPAVVRANLGITFAEVEVRRVEETIRVPGSFELDPRARHEYRMALPGRVELLVDEYESVAAGQPLYRFQSPAWPQFELEIIRGEQAMETARAEIAVAGARLEEARRKLELGDERLAALARAEFKRADLEADAAELEASLPRLEAELALAQTRLENARRTREHALHRAATAVGTAAARLEELVTVGERRVPAYAAMDWIEVRARAAGVVERLAATDGAFVDSPSLVLTTVDIARVRFRALALQGDLPRLRSGLQARIVPPRSPGYAITESVRAAMELGLEAHPAERTMTVLATPEERAAWIRPGVSAFLEIVVDGGEGPVLAIPTSAVVQDGLEHVFFRRDPRERDRVLRVVADLGPSDGRWVVVESGVTRGDEVVLGGAYELRLAVDAGRGTGDGASSGHVHADGTVHGEH